MAATAAAVGVGIGAAAGATAAAVRAARMKAKPRTSQYGGSQDALDAYRQAYGKGADQGSAQVTDAAKALQGVGRAGVVLGGQGQQTMLDSANIAERPVTTTGANMLAAYRPGAVSQAMSQQVLDANTAANLGAARAGGALGLRNALNANAVSGVQAAQGLAVQRAQEEQALLQARVAQENADRGAGSDAAALAQAQRVQLLQTGGQIAQAGLQARQAAAATGGQLGLTNQGQYLQSLQGVENSQLESDIGYDTRRQQEQQRKSNNLWGFAGNLTGIAGKAFGSAG